jgi:toxin-antitoxin system PIN domain toxin
MLDVNVLLALAWPNHQHHAAAHDWFRRESGRGWATCAFTQLGFIRLSSNPSYTSEAVAPQEAASLLAALVAHGKHRFWVSSPAADASIFAKALGHQQVNDAYLVRIAAQNRGRVVTFDNRLSVHAHREGLVCVLGADR